MTLERGCHTEMEISSTEELNLINHREIPYFTECIHSFQIIAAWVLPLLKFWIYIEFLTYSLCSLLDHERKAIAKFPLISVGLGYHLIT